MIRRYLHDPVLDSFRHFPVVLLTGAWQAGKSTLAQELIGRSWKASYLTLDDRVVFYGTLRNPDGLISGTPTPVVLDEVQRAPGYEPFKKAIGQLSCGQKKNGSGRTAKENC